MLKIFRMMSLWVLSIVFLMPAPLFSQELEPVQLPKPVMEGGKPLMDALRERQSSRDFSKEILSPQVLSNLLWAAAGMNRPGKRTAPSAMNWQEINVYAATADGLYRYDGQANVLIPIVLQDVRAMAGIQAFVKDVPVNLIYVADYDKMTIMGGLRKVPDSDKDLYSAAATGFIGQNVYLFCASEGLATVIRAGIDKAALAKVMKLRPSQKIILSQSVGYPKKNK